MQARVVTNQIQPGKMDEWIGICRDSIAPALAQESGFQGFVALADREANKGIGYSMWDSVEELNASETSGAYQAQIATLKDVVAAPPDREIYELPQLA